MFKYFKYVLVSRRVCYRIVMRYVENKSEVLEYASFTFYTKKELPTLVTHLDADFVKFFSYVLYVFLCECVCVFVFGRLKIRNLVRVYSTNLFVYRNITLGPVCIVACIAAHSSTR
jgi:hypothetical protein